MIRNSLLFSDKVRNYGFKMGVVNTDSEFIKEHIPPSKNKLQFIYEAIINSLEANDTEDVQIKIIFNFDKQTDGQRKLGQIDILDNGSGFTDESYERFRICANKSKKKNNRGCGRVQFYHNFKEVEVESVYKKGSKVKKRKFVYDSDNFGEAKIPEIIEDIASNEEMITCVSLKQYQGRDKSIDIITIDDFISSLQSNLLLRFYLENKSNIKINVRVEFKIGEESEKREIFNSSLPTPIEEGEIKVSYERITDKTGKLEFEPTEKKEFIKWSHFKIENDNSKGNEIKLCSKNIPVCDMSKFCGLDKMCQHSENKYLTVFYGDVFDKAENVNDSVDGFKFPRKRDFKKEEQDLFSDDFLFYETIEDEIKNVLPRIYKEIKDKIEAQKINAQELAKMYGIDQKYVDEIEINIADKEKEIVEKLYSKQAETLSKKAIKIRKLEGKLDSINPTDTDYEEKLNKLTEERLQLTEEQDREELSKYVIRRDFVVKLLQKILSERQIKEEVIQNLFFKRKSTAKTSDLWIFDEEFVHFEGYADNDLSRLEVDGEKLLRDSVDIETVLKSVGIEMGNALKWRPDIFLYPEEGKCILFEFKAPEVEVSKHCDQIQKYAKIIANYSKKEFRQFYGFLIGQQINPLAIPDRYKKAPCGSYWYYPSEPINNIATGVPIADIYQEIIPLSEIAKRAEIRNRSFAEKLGLSDQA